MCAHLARSRVALGCLWLCGAVAGVALGQEQFVLELAGKPAAQSTAVVGARGITIVDADGNRFSYVPRPEQNSRDGNFAAYYSEEARKFLRWPVSGAGTMYLGTRERDAIVWQRSQMQVRRVRRPGERITVDRPADGDDVSRRRGPVRPHSEPPQLAALAGPDRITVALVDGEGVLHLYAGRDGRWQHRESALREPLPSGAPLVLLEDDDAELPVVVTINELGQLVAIRHGRLRTLVAEGDPRFAPGSQLAALRRGAVTTLVAVDDRGGVWAFDPAGRTFTAVESRPGIFEPGIPLAGLTGEGADNLFLIDRRGHLLDYRFASGRWARPELVASGLVSRGGVAAIYAAADPRRAPVQTVSAVDATGRLHVWTDAGAGWDDDIHREVRLSPGAPVTLANLRDRLAVSAVLPDGRWMEWQRRGSAWSARAIADGFQAGSHVLMFAEGPSAFALDRTNRLVAGRLLGDLWECSICTPGFAFAPRLVRREVVPNEPLPPANVEFENRHNEELVVRLVDLAAPQRPLELTIPPGKSVRQPIERNSGATLEEVYLVPGPLGELVEEVHRHPLPPRALYNVVVYVNRVTSVYFDRTKNKSAVPDEASTSLVSLGVFSLPAGEQLQDGDRLDVYHDAATRRNPGAAALVDPPAP